MKKSQFWPSIAVFVLFPLLLWAQEDDATIIDSAKAAFEAGQYESVLTKLEPLLKRTANPGEEPDRVADLARMIAAVALRNLGEEHFRKAQIKESIADWDKQLQYSPEDEPGHWQRGIAFYYGGEFERGVKQFEDHRTVNPNDVENAVWHLLCAVRAPDGSLEKARESYIPIDLERDRRVPMGEIYEMFAGRLEPEAVLAAGAEGGAGGQFYADLYVGLFYEITDKFEKAMQHIARAGQNPNSGHYMGDVARVHLIVRDQEAKAQAEKPE